MPFWAVTVECLESSLAEKRAQLFQGFKKAVLTTRTIFWCVDIQRKNTVSTSRKSSNQQGCLAPSAAKQSLNSASSLGQTFAVDSSYQDQPKTVMAEIPLPIFTQERNVALWEKLAYCRGLFSIFPSELLNYCWTLEEYLILKSELVIWDQETALEEVATKWLLHFKLPLRLQCQQPHFKWCVGSAVPQGIDQIPQGHLLSQLKPHCCAETCN